MKIIEAHIVHEELLLDVPVKALSEPTDVYEYMKDIYRNFPRVETFWTICLNTRKKVISRHMVTQGTVNASLAHPREVFRVAVMEAASCVIVCHNHPSGVVDPSSADIAITRQLKRAGEILGIEVCDHIIIGDPQENPDGKGYFSFRLAGLM